MVEFFELVRLLLEVGLLIGLEFVLPYPLDRSIYPCPLMLDFVNFAVESSPQRRMDELVFVLYVLVLLLCDIPHVEGKVLLVVDHLRAPCVLNRGRGTHRILYCSIYTVPVKYNQS